MIVHWMTVLPLLDLRPEFGHMVSVKCEPIMGSRERAPVGSRDIAPDQGPPEAECLFALSQPEESTNLC